MLTSPHDAGSSCCVIFLIMLKNVNGLTDQKNYAHLIAIYKPIWLCEWWAESARPYSVGAVT